MRIENQATSLWANFFRFDLPQVRAFHMTWFAFFLCFFSWFGVAPLMPVIREELKLTKDQVGWTIIASVSITIFARLLIGWLCDYIGPRLTYSGLLLVSAVPVMGIGLSNSFETFLIFRLLIGAIGASFVITQYHTSIMFAPNCVGTANATAAGWGNLGGGVTQFVMPLLLALFVGVFGVSTAVGWRLSMVIAGITCALTGIAYYFVTQDAPKGNFRELRAEGKLPPGKYAAGAFMTACMDYRVWLLAIIYGACFGIELTIDNIAATYFVDQFGLGLEAAGFAAAAFGMMNIFARMLGGVVGDRFGAKWGLQGRTTWLFIVLLCEGIGLMLFSQAQSLILAIPLLMGFGLFVKMSNGATYSVTPFVNRNAMGAVAGIVGAGGNIGAVAAGFLFKSSLEWSTCLLVLGTCVASISFLAFGVRFSPETAPITDDKSGAPIGASRKRLFGFKSAPADVV